MIISWLKSNGLYAEVSASNPLPVNATVNATASAVSTAAAPTYVEGSTNSLSTDLSGGLRITGTINASSSMHSTTADPSYVNGSDNALSSDLSGYLRVLAKQTGTWNVGLSAGSNLVGKVGIDQTTPGTTNAVDVTNFPVTVDVNSGAKSNSTLRVVLATDQPALTNALKVDGSAVIQPASQSGTWTVGISASQTIGVTQGTAANLNATVVGTGTFAVQAAQSGTWNITNVSGTISLPTGAATAAKQPALGTAGSASADVITIQGAASMTAVKVDGSGVTQPVSGTVTANPGGNTPVKLAGLSNSATAVVSSVAATLEDYYIYNPNASVAYVQIYDVATAGGVTVGTTAAKWSIGIPATSAANISGLGLSFANGIQVAATTAAGNATAPGTALDCNFGYR